MRLNASRWLVAMGGVRACGVGAERWDCEARRYREVKA